MIWIQLNRSQGYHRVHLLTNLGFLSKKDGDGERAGEYKLTEKGHQIAVSLLSHRQDIQLPEPLDDPSLESLLADLDDPQLDLLEDGAKDEKDEFDQLLDEELSLLEIEVEDDNDHAILTKSKKEPEEQYQNLIYETPLPALGKSKDQTSKEEAQSEIEIDIDSDDLELELSEIGEQRDPELNPASQNPVEKSDNLQIIPRKRMRFIS